MMKPLHNQPRRNKEPYSLVINRFFGNDLSRCSEHQRILSFETIRVAGKKLMLQVDKISKTGYVFFSPVRWVSVCSGLTDSGS